MVERAIMEYTLFRSLKRDVDLKNPTEPMKWWFI